jgi:hypothetical protein
MSERDDLLTEARRRLQEIEKEDENGGELGERIDLNELESFVGRWRGEGTMRSKEGDSFDVYLLWDEEGQRRFHYRNARLVWEIDAAKPSIGDEIAIVRGTDLPAQGDFNPTQRFAVRTRSCSDPLPEGHPRQANLSADAAGGIDW